MKNTIVGISCGHHESSVFFYNNDTGNYLFLAEEWVSRVKGDSKFPKFAINYVKENIVDFILDKNTKENLTSLFANLKDENSLVSIENLNRFVGPFGNTSLYIYLCYIFYMNLSFCISSKSQIAELKLF